jgi:hypothetical protein
VFSPRLKKCRQLSSDIPTAFETFFWGLLEVSSGQAWSEVSPWDYGGLGGHLFGHFLE